MSLNPSASAIVDALGARAHLVGITRYGRLEGIPVVGDMQPPLERVLAREPDAVLVGDFPSQRAVRDQLVALGVRVIVVPTVRIEDLRASTEALGALVGRQARAEELNAALDEALARAQSRASQRRRVRVLLVFDEQQGYIYSTGGGDHLGELLEVVGADNIAAGGALTARLGLDAVLARAPELILHISPTPRFPDSAAALSWWRGALPDLPAVKRAQVFVWPDDHLAQNTPALASAVDRLVELVDAAAAAGP